MARVVVVLAAPGSVPAAVRDVLRDWVSLGLVQPLLWVEASEVTATSSVHEVVAAHLLGGSAPRVRLQEFLADQQALDLLRLVVLDAAGGRGAARVDTQVARQLGARLHQLLSGRVSICELVLARHGDGARPAEGALPGWQTLVVAPEDRWSPDPRQAPTELALDGDAAAFAAHGAAALASAVGLWTGVTEGVLDGREVSDPVALRSFLRRLDASQVSAGLRAALMDVSTGLPRPQVGAQRCDHLQEPSRAATGMAQQVVDRFPDLFDLRLEGEPSRGRAQVGPVEAIRLFLAFLVDVLRSTPARLREGALNAGAGFVSRKVQLALFGDGESEYQVVTRGVTASGLPPGVDDLGSVADHVRRRLQPVFADEQPMPDVQPFWSTVVGAGLTLADAGDRPGTVEPVRVGGRPAVVRDTSVVAPPPASAFALPPAAANRAGTSRVSPYDLYEQERVAVSLTSSAADADGRRLAGEFEAWRARLSGSYTGTLGLRLAGLVGERGRTLSTLLQQLSEAERVEVDTDRLAAEHRASRRTLLRYLLGMLLLVALGVVVAVREWLTPGVLAAVGTVVALTWTAVHVRALVRHQQRIFAIEHTRRVQDARLEVAARNLPRVAQSLFVLATLYQQYLQWAPVLGRFLSEPFGPPVPAPEPARLHGRLPRAVGLGVVEPDHEAVLAVAHDVSSQVFERGWLSPLWDALVADAPRRLGGAGYVVRDDPDALWRDPATDEGGPLRRWSAAVARDGVDRTSGDALWGRARTVLAEDDGALLHRLMTRVEVQAQEGRPREDLTGRDFFSLLTDGLQAVQQHYFQPSLFTPTAVLDQRHVVDRTLVIGQPAAAGRLASQPPGVQWVTPDGIARDDLDQFVVVVQTSRPTPGSGMQLGGADMPVEEHGGGGAHDDDDLGG